MKVKFNSLPTFTKKQQFTKLYVFLSHFSTLNTHFNFDDVHTYYIYLHSALTLGLHG